VVDQLLGGLPPILVYAVVALCVAAESAFLAGLILPAATALIAMGLLANAGVVAVVPAAVVGALAALLGGSLAYASGLRNGPKMRSRRPDRWERADRLFARYGGRAVFVGQWVVGARTLVPRLAGINGMRYREFALRQMPSAMLWALWMVGASYLAGARRGRRVSLLALGPIVPMAVLVLAVSWKGWSAPDVLIFPPVAEFDGPLPAAAGSALAQAAGASVAPLAAACGLVGWLLWRWLSGPLRMIACAALATVVTVSAGSWVYLGWSRLSETIAALLLGAAWAAVNAAIWSGRLDREDRRQVAVQGRQVAVQDSTGAVLEPVQEPRKPNVVAAPAPSRPL
jgi:membrane protein DedA with SNARE-associated domain